MAVAAFVWVQTTSPKGVGSSRTFSNSSSSQVSGSARCRPSRRRTEWTTDSELVECGQGVEALMGDLVAVFDEMPRQCFQSGV